MKTRNRFVVLFSLALLLPAAVVLLAPVACTGNKNALARPVGPCDIYAEAGNPCVAAHSSTRALYAAYDGPLYQVMRQSDGKLLDIGVVPATATDPGGYADAAAQDKFCADTYCWITVLYDQSGKGNHLIQAPRGGFSGPSMGGSNNLPVADMAPVSLAGHKVYGIFIAPGMGLRWNDAKGTAVDDQAEGQYWVVNGHHYNSGCCFDYGNAETDSRDDGDGTMETTYYGNATAWYRGQAPGPWIMTDQENNLVGCVNESPYEKFCENLKSITWRFVMATADGEPHHWRSMGGDARQGALEVMFDGPRIKNDRSSYDPMRKQGAILLGNGGDNSVGSQGTYYEGAMTAPGTFPTEETNQKIQANIVAAAYDTWCLTIAPAGLSATPTGLQTFAPLTSQQTEVVFTNTTGAPVNQLTLGIEVPRGWTSVVSERDEELQQFSEPVAPGTSVAVKFQITSGKKAFNGDLVARATWTDPETGTEHSASAFEKVRNMAPVKINEFATGSGDNATNAFIELYNASDSEIDISNWTLTQHQAQMPVFSAVKIPSGTKIAAKGFYLLGLSNSGLAVSAKKGETTLYVRNIDGMSVGDVIEIGSGDKMESRTIAEISKPSEPQNSDDPMRRMRRAAPGTPTTIWQPLPEGPIITIPSGSKSIPVTSVDGFKAGDKMAIGYGATYPTVSRTTEKYEVVTITEVGKPGTQAWLSMDAKAGDTHIKVSSVENISVGDSIRLDIESEGHGIEWVTVKAVGTKSSRSTFNGPLSENDDPGTGLELEAPLKFNHASNMPFSVWGTGISFEPASRFDHSSNEPVLPLCYALVLDKPLSRSHEIDAAVRDEKVLSAGYQGSVKPDQWFGGPALSSSSGNMVLRDAKGNVADALNYGGLADPWAAEGYQAESGAGKSGCYVVSPGARAPRGRTASPVAEPSRSVGRFPDGLDSDQNCLDFYLQNTAMLAMPADAGSNNIKVSSVNDFSAGQNLIIDAGELREEVTITSVGTSGGSTLRSASRKGATYLLVNGTSGFRVGQTVVVDSDTQSETAVIAALVAARGQFGRPAGGASDTIKIAQPLAKAHAEGIVVAGTGITLSKPLAKAHNGGVFIAGSLPTPGSANQYAKRQ